VAIPTKIEVFLVLDGTSVDVTGQVAFSEGVTIEDRGRASSLEGISPSILTFTLDNHDGNFTPGNPLSLWYPHFAEDVPVSVVVTINGVTSTRFEGFITSISPAFVGGVSSLSQVVVRAADGLSRLARISFDSFWAEEIRFLGTVYSHTLDLWEFSGDSGATEYDNTGLIAGVRGLELTPAVVTGLAAGGAVETSASEDSQFRNVLTLRPPSTGAGPVVELKLRPKPSSTVREVRLPFKLEDGYVPAVGESVTLLQYWDTSGTDRVLLSVRVINSGGAPALAVYDAAGVLQDSAPLKRSSGWNYLTSFQYGPPDSTYFLLGADDFGFGADGLSALSADTVYIGGNGNPSAPGKTSKCVPGLSIGGVCFAQEDTLTRNYNTIDLASNNNTGGTTMDYLCGFAGVDAVFIGGDARRLWFDKICEETALDKMQKYMGSIGGYFWSSPPGEYQALFPGAVRTLTLAASVALGEDDDATDPVVLTSEIDGSPTRVTVTAPFGSVTATDPGPRRDATIDAVCIDRTAALALAYHTMRRSKALRVARLTVDLVTARTAALTQQLFNLRPTDRLRVSGFNSKILGVTYAEYYVQGWSERYTPFSAVFTLFTEPADDPPTGVLDDVTYGRIGSDGCTVTGGTALGGVNPGTIVISSPPGNALTVNPSDYPLDLSWAGERITLAAPPASAVSPQTVTITARGVAPSVARVHSPGETIDVWYPAHFTL